MDVKGGERGDVITLNVSFPDGTRLNLMTSLETKVNSLKILVEQNCLVSAEHQRLIYSGQYLKNNKTLMSYGMTEVHTIHMVVPTNKHVAVYVAHPADLSKTKKVLIQNPNVIREIMDLQQISNDPDVMRSFILNTLLIT